MATTSANGTRKEKDSIGYKEIPANVYYGIQTARAVGATSNFSGSGGAVTGTFEDDPMFRKLEESYAPLGIKVIRPKVNP